MGESNVDRQPTGTRRILHIAEPYGDRSDAMGASLRTVGAEVDTRADVYRGLAFLGNGGGGSLSGVVVCVDDLAADANEFFALARGLAGGAAVLAYSRTGAARRLRDAMLSGATGVVEATPASLAAALDRADAARSAKDGAMRVGRGASGPVNGRRAPRPRPDATVGFDRDRRRSCVPPGVTARPQGSDAVDARASSHTGPDGVEDGPLLTQEEIELLISGCAEEAGDRPTVSDDRKDRV